MPDALAVNAEGISKKFSRTFKLTMKYGMQDIAKGVLAIPSQSGTLREGEFWAVDEVSFQLRKGETLGVIGVNGSGKSTVLKMLNGIYMPDKGKIAVDGSVSALIEVGAGFHPMLTGRENIYINGMILGMSRKEIDRKFKDIVQFADIGDFLDSPVKYYSTGMYVRLGFSVAIHCEPDMLLIDEILSVGDFNFREKCLTRMREIRRSGKSIVFVSHSLASIEAMCDRVLLLFEGRMQAIGKPREVVSFYLNQQEKRAFSEFRNSRGSPETDSASVTIEKVALADRHGAAKDEFAFGEGMAVRIHYDARRRVEKPVFGLRIIFGGIEIAEASMLVDGYGPDYIEGKGFIECTFESMPLIPGIYEIFLFARSSEGIADIITSDIYSRFRVTDEGLDKIPMKGPMALIHLRQGPVVYVHRSWRWGKEGG